MRLTLLILVPVLATACAPGGSDEDAPPILPWTGHYETEDQEWLEQSRTSNASFIGRVFIEERSEHFGMVWGGTYDFGSGNCRVAQDYTFSCPTSEIERGDDVRRSVIQSKMTGHILGEVRLEVRNEVTFWCEGTGCPPDDEGFYGVETARLVWMRR